MYLTKAKRLEILSRAKRDFIWFCQNFLFILDKKDQRIIPFKLNPQQKELAKLLVSGAKRIIILKARQIGLTTLIRAYNFWRWYFTTEPENFILVNTTEEKASDNFRDFDKFFYENLPSWMRRPLKKANESRMVLADSKAKLSTGGSKAKGGLRSMNAAILHITEFALFENQEEFLASASAVVSKDGQIIIESTVQRTGDKYEELVKGARSGSNEWTLAFFHWKDCELYNSIAPPSFSLTPEEQELSLSYKLSIEQIAWRRSNLTTLGPHKFKQEYPNSVDEAFEASDGNYFWPELWDGIELLKCTGAETFFLKPEKHQEFIGGVDSASGKGLDSAVVYLIDRFTYEPVYLFFSNKITTAQLAELVLDLHLKYNRPLWNVECNFSDLLIADLLRGGMEKAVCVPGRTLSSPHGLATFDGEAFRTTAKSKAMIYEHLKQLLVDKAIAKLPIAMCDQLKALVVKNINPEAPNGRGDDLAISCALSFFLTRFLKQEQPPKYIETQMSRHMKLSMLKSRVATN